MPQTSRSFALTLAWALVGPLQMAASAQTLPQEVQVGAPIIIDYEFDWGRDGVFCASCNYGAGNARLSYVDKDHNLWVGYIDPVGGGFYPSNGQVFLVDTNVATAHEIGNGPEWMLSQRGSELVYDRWTGNVPHSVSSLTLGFARAGNGSWVAGPVADTSGMVLPVGSLDINDPIPALHYQSFAVSGRPSTIYRREVSGGAVASPVTTSTDPAMTRRWVPNSRNICITMPAAPVAGKAWKQVFLFHTDTGEMEQLTSDRVDKLWGWMWRAPEYDNEYVFSAVVNANLLNIYRKLPVLGGGSAWRVVNSIAMPTQTPYINSPEPFVHNGKSYIFFSLSSNSDLHDYTATSQIAMTGITPDYGPVRVLTSDVPDPRARKDPEYYITANGPYIYYNRYLQGTGTTPQISEGVFRIDTWLGPAR